MKAIIIVFRHISYTYFLYFFTIATDYIDCIFSVLARAQCNEIVKLTN